MDKSRLNTDSIKDVLNFTLTLNCQSFKDVSYSPLLLDLLLYLISISSGNDEKRERVKKILGEGRFEAMKKVLEVIE